MDVTKIEVLKAGDVLPVQPKEGDAVFAQVRDLVSTMGGAAVRVDGQRADEWLGANLPGGPARARKASTKRVKSPAKKK